MLPLTPNFGHRSLGEAINNSGVDEAFGCNLNWATLFLKMQVKNLTDP